jgi:hypothetical protein
VSGDRKDRKQGYSVTCGLLASLAVGCRLRKFEAAENVKKADKMSVNSKSGGARCRHGYVPIYYKLL